MYLKIIFLNKHNGYGYLIYDNEIMFLWSFYRKENFAS